jgi:hypothetical protein
MGNALESRVRKQRARSSTSIAVAIVRRKSYCDRVDFLIHSWTVFLVAVEYFQEESS